VTARLGARTSPEVEAMGGSSLLVVPLGACEQHGPHLPLDTDSIVAVALCEALAARRGDVLVAPLLGVGASGEHAGFAGTLSVGTEVLAGLLTELVRSSRGWSRGTVLVSGHGGNLDALEAAATLAVHEGDAVCTFVPIVRGGDAHAGRTETSMLLALDPCSVRHNEVVVGATEPLASVLGVLRRDGVRAVSANGVLGDPRQACADEGRGVLAALTDDLCEIVLRTFGPPS
jgi:creatinine amidohydrolase